MAVATAGSLLAVAGHPAAGSLVGRPVAAVGFDLDYTLWDQDDFARSFFAEVAGEFGRRMGLGDRQVAEACRDALDRLTLAHPRLFDQVLHQLGVWDPRLVAEWVERYRRHRPPARLYPGAAALLARLKAAGLRLFLVTDGQGGSQRHKVAALGLGPWFEQLVFTGDLPAHQHKPSPYPFRLACRCLRLPPELCLYVGDNPSCDFAGPRSLGMGTIGVATGPYARLQVPPEQAPQARVASLEELARLLVLPGPGGPG